MKGVSLFSGAGIGETFLNECGIDIVVANELIEKRANLYKAINPSCKVICQPGDNIFSIIGIYYHKRL